MKKRILIVDDEKILRDFMLNFFEDSKKYVRYRIDIAVDGQDAIAKIKNHSYEIVITDLKMPNKNGLDVIEFCSKNSPNSDTVLLTAHGGGESAEKAMAFGAYEYIEKPISVEELEITVDHIIERRNLISENRKIRKKLLEKQAFPKIIGNSKVLNDIMNVVKVVASTDSTVLITGESGTGKELVAEAIHTLSNRRDNNYIKVNCAALPENLIESELFGYEKGAFTGSIKKTRGKFELAHGGSILLDEISEMNLDLQSKLLRIIQEKEFSRLGSEEVVSVDSRIIATSNKDLVEVVKEGKFRKDLFFRLNIVPIHLPALRKRKDDIPALAENFIKEICFKMGKDKKILSDRALAKLENYDWPGNIRELHNILERAIIISQDRKLVEKDLKFIRFDSKEEEYSENTNSDIDNEDTIVFSGRTFESIEKEIIFKTLKKNKNNKSKTAQLLGITSRTLRNKLKKYEQEDGKI